MKKILIKLGLGKISKVNLKEVYTSKIEDFDNKQAALEQAKISHKSNMADYLTGEIASNDSIIDLTVKKHKETIILADKLRDEAIQKANDVRDKIVGEANIVMDKIVTDRTEANTILNSKLGQLLSE